MTFVGQVFSILTVFIKIIGIIFLIHIGILILQFCIAGGFARKNPFKLLWNMLPAYFTALGTQSSAATIPVTLRQTVKNGVSEDIAGFVIPLCATIHLSGSTLKIVACALALMMMQGMPYDFPMFAGFICMLGVTMVAAPGVPGGAIMACLGILQSMLGFGESEQALMIALYIAMDSFGTACNVTGDGAIALIINKIYGKKKTDSPKSNLIVF
jgi:Na+/H+-dicarboxylate symporter